MEIDIHVRYTMMYVGNIDLKKIVLVIANLCNMQVICKYICAHGFD